MAGAVKVGYWGAPAGGPRDINDCSQPQRLVSFTVCSSDVPNGRIYGFSFVYVDQRGEAIKGNTWGSTYPACVKLMTMNPGEHINNVSGTADRSGITSLKLGTNQSEYGPYGYAAGPAFSVPLQQGKGEVVAFFGRSGRTLKALGVYVPAKKDWPVKVGPWGGHGGIPQDIRLSNKPDQLQSITISSSQAGGGRVHGFSFTYVDQRGVPVTVGPWGKHKRQPLTISLNPGEYVNHITGTTDSYGITFIKFCTNMNKEGYGPFGCRSGAAFSVPLPDNGTDHSQRDNAAAVAFFARSDQNNLISIGVYVGIVPRDGSGNGGGGATLLGSLLSLFPSRRQRLEEEDRGLILDLRDGDPGLQRSSGVLARGDRGRSARVAFLPQPPSPRFPAVLQRRGDRGGSPDRGQGPLVAQLQGYLELGTSYIWQSISRVER